VNLVCLTDLCDDLSHHYAIVRLYVMFSTIATVLSSQSSATAATITHPGTVLRSITNIYSLAVAYMYIY
jgi:hypothetical protein